MNLFFQRQVLLIVCLFLGCYALSAKDYTVALSSDAKDKITISYSIVEQGGCYVVRFTGVRKALGIKHSEKYRKLEDIKVVFFDRTGGYRDCEFSSDINTEAFRINRDVMRYKVSDDGYFFLKDNPELRIEVTSNQPVSLSIPIYLAHYEKKHHYKIISKCENLILHFDKMNKKESSSSEEDLVRKKIVSTEEQVQGEADLTPTEMANNLIGNIDEVVSREDVTVEELQRYIDELIGFKSSITDRGVLSSVNNAIIRCKERMKEVSELSDAMKKDSQEKEIKQAQENEAEQNLDYAKELLSKDDDLSDSDIAELKSTANQLRKESHSIKNSNQELAKRMKQTADECDKKISEIESAKKRKNIWLIVGGVLLTILMFIGNQFFRHFRSVQKAKSFEDMQNKIAQQAQNEAKRRAESMVRSKINRAQGAARQKSRELVKDNINKAIKGKGNKKGFSI